MSKGRTSLWVAVLAVAVAAGALYVSITTMQDQADFNKRQIEHNRLSLTPVLGFERVLVPDPSRPFVGLYLYNVGGGPAKDLQLTVQVKRLDELEVSMAAALASEGEDPMTGLRDMLKELYPGSPQMVRRTGTPRAVAPRSSLFMLGILAEDFDEEWVAAFQQLMSHVELEITCHSLYEDEVTVHSKFLAE